MNKENIRKIKESTLAVGLVKKNEAIPLTICGSGFIIDENGIIVTAEHVLDGCKTARKYFKEKMNLETYYAVFRPIHNVSKLSFDSAVIGDLKNITQVKKSENFPLEIIDLGFGKMISPIDDCFPLEFDTARPEIFDDIALCGFPSGDYSLDLKGTRMGIRYSSLFQTGKISGLLPFDDVPNPYGIQTDIIGVGGSSGSSITNLNSGKVIGIAQQVLPADVEVIVDNIQGKQLNGSGIAKIGQVYGISNVILNDIVIGVKKYYNEGKTDDLSIHASGIEFTEHTSKNISADDPRLQ